MWPFRKRSADPKPPATPEKRVVFFHVMKTGGLTFRSILASVYGDAFRLIRDEDVASVQAELNRLQAIEFHNMKVRGGHGYGHTGLARANRWDLLDNCHCFTMLREPVDHMVSTFYYALERRPKSQQLCDENGVAFPNTIEEFLESPANLNLQTAFLANRMPYAGEAPIVRDDLKTATGLLARLDMRVGLTERFADSINIFETATGRHLPGDIVKNQNRNPRRLSLDAIPESLKQQIRATCELDVELYELGRSLFLHDLARCQPTRRYSFLDASNPTPSTTA